MPLSKLNVGTYQEMSTHATYEAILGQLSQLAEPLWTDPGLKHGSRVRELTSTSKRKKKKKEKRTGGE